MRCFSLSPVTTGLTKIFFVQYIWLITGWNKLYYMLLMSCLRKPRSLRFFSYIFYWKFYSFSLWSISSKLLYMGRVSIKGHFLHIQLLQHHWLERLSFLCWRAFCSGRSSVVEAHVGYFLDFVFHDLLSVCMLIHTDLITIALYKSEKQIVMLFLFYQVFYIYSPFSIALHSLVYFQISTGCHSPSAWKSR